MSFEFCPCRQFIASHHAPRTDTCLDGLHRDGLQATVCFRTVAPGSGMASCREESIFEYVVSSWAAPRFLEQCVAKSVESFGNRMVLRRSRRWNCLPSHGDGARPGNYNCKSDISQGHTLPDDRTIASRASRFYLELLDPDYSACPYIILARAVMLIRKLVAR